MVASVVRSRELVSPRKRVPASPVALSSALLAARQEDPAERVSQIRDAARTAADLARLDPTITLRDALARAARTHSAAALSRLSRLSEPFGNWDNLVLPPELLQQCRELLAAVQSRRSTSARR